MSLPLCYQLNESNQSMSFSQSGLAPRSGEAGARVQVGNQFGLINPLNGSSLSVSQSTGSAI